MDSKIKMILQILFMAFALSSAQYSHCGQNELAATKMVNSLGFQLEKMMDNQNNYFFSPLSISVALAMVYIGARGNTREQIAEALDYNIVGRNCLPNKISENFQGLISSIRKNGDGYSLQLANGVFIEKSFKVSHFYSSNLERFFNTNVNRVDFDDEAETMNEINQWVSNNTRNQIPKLLNEPLDPATVMILINAVYFKGSWATPFNATRTENGTFYGPNNTEKEVPFMTLEAKQNIFYDQEKQYKILELEYSGGNVSMIILLPDEEEFPQYDLTSQSLCDLRKRFEYLEVGVTIPKFKLEFGRELKKDMMNLGMTELFSDRADLTGIQENSELHVSVMVHKAVVEVNEGGSEASATSGIGIISRKPMRDFVANHPFLFYIIHTDSNTILFSGRVVNL